MSETNVITQAVRISSAPPHRPRTHLRCASKPPSAPRFEILSLQRSRFGDKVADVIVHVAGIGQFDAEVFEPAGRQAFIRCKPLRRWDRQDEHVVRFEAAFSDAMCVAIAARLDEMESAL